MPIELENEQKWKIIFDDIDEMNAFISVFFKILHKPKSVGFTKTDFTEEEQAVIESLASLIEPATE